MKSQYDSPLAKRRIYFTKNKLTTPTFQKIKLFKTKPNVSSSNLLIDIQQDHNFTLKITKNQAINLKKSKNPIEYDSEYLKSDLIAFRSEVQKRKNELLLLKIKYGKLLVDNINNKTLIANILCIPMNKLINRQILLSEINNCELSKEVRQTLKYAYKILVLKMELNSKKELLSKKIMYLNMLNENSKINVLSHLQSEYFIKCEQQRSLLKVLTKLEEKYNLQENEILELEEKLKNQNIKSENLIGKEVQDFEQLSKIIGQKDDIMKEINVLNNKINKKQRIYHGKRNEIKSLEKSNSYEQYKLKLIKVHPNTLSGLNDQILKKKKSQEEEEIFMKNQKEEIKNLQEEFLNLKVKLKNYIDEKPKLIEKSHERKDDIKYLESLLNELDSIKKIKSETEQNINKRQQELKEIETKYKEEFEQNDKQIQINIDIKKELKKNIETLNKKLNKAVSKKNGIKSKINQAQNEINKLNKNEIIIKKKLERKNTTLKEKLDKELEEKKNNYGQRLKKEIEDLKIEQEKLINDKKGMEDENKLMQEKIIELDNELADYDHILEEFNKVRDKMGSYMYKELVDNIPGQK
jgi:exonuclease SbcC